MNTRLVRLAVACALGVFFSSANAALISRLGGSAYFDDVLGITWLTDANLAASNTFGVAGIFGNGDMTWDKANEWIAAMNTDGGTGYLGFNGWRLPTLTPIDGSTFNTGWTNNATTDLGYATTTTGGSDGGWRDGSGNAVSELGHMYYVNLSNLGFCTPNGSGSSTSCDIQTGSGPVNTGPFSNLVSTTYWTGLEFTASPPVAWHFVFGDGNQGASSKASTISAWAVLDGDVIPVPAAVWLFGSALGLLGWIRRRTA